MKIKIIATLGPSTQDFEVLQKLVLAGASGFRINFSHGDPSQWARFVGLVRKVEEELSTRLGLIGDLQGPNVRLGIFNQQIVRVERNKTYRLVLSHESEDDQNIPVPVKEFFNVVEVGDTVLVGDNMTSFRIIDKLDGEALAEALVDGEIKSRMAVRIKDKEIEIPYITSKDSQDLAFAVENQFSHIMISFVRSGSDVLLVKRALKEMREERLRIIAKIETRKGLENLDEIIMNSDGVVVARGDLGKVYPLENLPEIQNVIVRKSRQYGKPVYIATQLLSSMVDNPLPTRSEVFDIYTSVKEGVDGLILTNETSIGRYPVESIGWARKIIEKAEEGEKMVVQPSAEDLPWKFGRGIIELSDLLGSSILIYSLTGKAMRIASAFRPRSQFFTGSPDHYVLRDCAILFGCIPVHINSYDYDEGIEMLKQNLKRRNVLREGMLVISSYKFSNLDKQKIIIEKI